MGHTHLTISWLGGLAQGAASTVFPHPPRHGPSQGQTVRASQSRHAALTQGIPRSTCPSRGTRWMCRRRTTGCVARRDERPGRWRPQPICWGDAQRPTRSDMWDSVRPAPVTHRTVLHPMSLKRRSEPSATSVDRRAGELTRLAPVSAKTVQHGVPLRSRTTAPVHPDRGCLLGSNGKRGAGWRFASDGSGVCWYRPIG